MTEALFLLATVLSEFLEPYLVQEHLEWLCRNVSAGFSVDEQRIISPLIRMIQFVDALPNNGRGRCRDGVVQISRAPCENQPELIRSCYENDAFVLAHELRHLEQQNPDAGGQHATILRGDVESLMLTIRRHIPEIAKLIDRAMQQWKMTGDKSCWMGLELPLERMDGTQRMMAEAYVLLNPDFQWLQGYRETSYHPSGPSQDYWREIDCNIAGLSAIYGREKVAGLVGLLAHDLAACLRRQAAY